MRCKHEKKSQVWLNAALELPLYTLKELPIYKDGMVPGENYKGDDISVSNHDKFRMNIEV